MKNFIKSLWKFLTSLKNFQKMWPLPQKCVLATKFFFLLEKNLLLHMVMMKKVADRGFFAFWPFENDRKFRRKRKNAFEIRQKVSIALPDTLECTDISSSYKLLCGSPIPHYKYQPLRQPLSWILSLYKSNSSVHLFHDQFVTMRKLSLFQTLWNYNFIASTTTSVKWHRVRIIIITG